MKWRKRGAGGLGEDGIYVGAVVGEDQDGSLGGDAVGAAIFGEAEEEHQEAADGLSDGENEQVLGFGVGSGFRKGGHGRSS